MNLRKAMKQVKGKEMWFTICMVWVSFMAMAQTTAHPRIYVTDQERPVFVKSLESVEWKKELVNAKKERLAKYISYWEKDPEWLVSRLQMNWNTKHDKVFLKGGDFSHSKGKAPVPTVRYSGTRDWATDYERPKLEEVQPYFDDPRGLYLRHKESGKMEWVHPSRSGFAIDKINEQIMELVADAAFLHWLTGEQKYADFAAPVFFTYMEGMYYRDAPIDLEKSEQANISGLATFEVIHEGIVVSLVTTYDFLYNYFKANKKDLDTSVAVFQKWGDQIIKKGIPDNNWNLFQARFLTYIGLVLEGNQNYKNGKGQEYFLDHTFNISTDRQIAIKESLLVYDQENAMWPECASYSVHVITTFLRIFTLLDHATNANEFANFPIVERAALASFQYLFPSGYTVGFGDSHHKMLPPENFELLVANYRKYGQVEKEKLISGLLSEMVNEGVYDRRAKDFFELFFYTDHLIENHSKEDVNTDKLVSPTFYAPNVSMLNQRMGKGENAVMASIVGSFGNHAHANGISLELYANNYVLGTDMGRGPSYWHDDHRNFYSRFPAHNTVVVDGQSDYAAMRTYFPFKLENVFPKSGERPSFDKVTFSNVSFVEPKTVSDQQRFTAVIASNSKKPYVIDVFRSKKQKGGRQKHEYIYHNLGQSLEFFDVKNNPLKTTPTDELSSSKGDLKGYDYFTDKRKTINSGDIRAIFTLKSSESPDNFMKLWVKGSENQTLYKVNSPKSNALSEGTAPKEVLEKPIPTLILKRDEAAWEHPFAVIFNPFMEGEANPIAKVSFSSVPEYPNTQIIDVLLNDKITLDRTVLNASESDVVSKDGFYQKGLLSILRLTHNEADIEFMFLSGMEKFESHGWDIVSSGRPFSFTLEKTPNGYAVSNDNPITINMPLPKEGSQPEIQLYEDGKLVASRKGTTNRNNSGQVVFKLSKSYDKVLITY
ncbi:heparinase II/III domain-containing protein [Zobellia uliginosa]|uniref:heparinase II/III domain-containing protein n=1 Tax=Zobellia uliginosa TaxID=143224 RepID=UPI0026E2AE0F|nr:heparinase II/III family protein [Zobellia uliginosa]MDO6518628.1 heparinase II/III family protein [Zobellia uliginosa]